MYEGARIRLRRVDPDREAEDRYRWLNDPEVLRCLGMRPGQFSRAEVRQYLETAAQNSDGLAASAVETREGHPIGGCALREFNDAARSATFGLRIGEAGYRGRGYGTEVTRLIPWYSEGRCANEIVMAVLPSDYERVKGGA